MVDEDVLQLKYWFVFSQSLDMLKPFSFTVIFDHRKNIFLSIIIFFFYGELLYFELELHTGSLRYGKYWLQAWFIDWVKAVYNNSQSLLLTCQFINTCSLIILTRMFILLRVIKEEKMSWLFPMPPYGSAIKSGQIWMWKINGAMESSIGRKCLFGLWRFI